MWLLAKLNIQSIKINRNIKILYCYNHYQMYLCCYLRKKCDPEKYAEFLRDGTIIAQVLAASCPTPLGQAKQLSDNPSERERIEKLIFDLFDFGVQPSNLFEPDDLLKAKNIPQVK